ncbi:MAG: hypothetical protein WC204_03430 [Elusimicrobiales bacterium]|jgi:hypothetical protein
MSKIGEMSTAVFLLLSLAACGQLEGNTPADKMGKAVRNDSVSAVKELLADAVPVDVRN